MMRSPLFYWPNHLFQRIYANTLKIFYDPFGGDRFGAVWDASLKNPRPFRVLGGFSSLPSKKVSHIYYTLCTPINSCTGNRENQREGISCLEPKLGFKRD